MTSEEVIAYEKNGGYNPGEIYNKDPNVKRTLDHLVDGTYSKDRELFRPLFNSLLNTINSNKADQYFILKDFESYIEAQSAISEAYRDAKKWAKMAILNTASCGKFSSDRTIQEYVDEIWHIDKLDLSNV